MKKIYLTTLFALLLACTSAVAQDAISMKTSKNVGDTIELKLVYTGKVTITGVKEPADKSRYYKKYTLTSQDVIIKGDISELYCSANNITQVDVSHSPNLQGLHCYSNPIASLNVSQNTALQVLDCTACDLDALDVSKNTGLQRIACSSNRFTELDLSQNANLQVLSCYNNHLATLNLSKNPQLVYLDCCCTTFSAEAVSDMLNSLPNLSTQEEKGSLYVYDTREDAQNFIFTTEHVNQALERGWKAFDTMGSPYPGATVSGVDATETAINDVPESIYTVDGRRLTQMQHGINIVKMKSGRTVKIIK